MVCVSCGLLPRLPGCCGRDLRGTCAAPANAQQRRVGQFITRAKHHAPWFYQHQLGWRSWGPLLLERQCSLLNRMCACPAWRPCQSLARFQSTQPGSWVWCLLGFLAILEDSPTWSHTLSDEWFVPKSAVAFLRPCLLQLDRRFWLKDLFDHTVKHSAPHVLRLAEPVLAPGFAFSLQSCWTIRAPAHWPVCFARFRLQSWVHLARARREGDRQFHCSSSHPFELDPCPLCGIGVSSAFHLLAECYATFHLSAICLKKYTKPVGCVPKSQP